MFIPLLRVNHAAASVLEGKLRQSTRVTRGELSFFYSLLATPYSLLFHTSLKNLARLNRAPGNTVSRFSAPNVRVTTSPSTCL